MPNDIQEVVMMFPVKERIISTISPNRCGYMFYAFEIPEIGNPLFFICF